MIAQENRRNKVLRFFFFLFIFFKAGFRRLSRSAANPPLSRGRLNKISWFCVVWARKQIKYISVARAPKPQAPQGGAKLKFCLVCGLSRFLPFPVSISTKMLSGSLSTTPPPRQSWRGAQGSYLIIFLFVISSAIA